MGNLRFAQIVVIALVTAALASHAQAQFEGTYQVVVKKQQEKEDGRWSIESWLAQKHQNQLMDLWLSKNSHSSLYEFFLDVESYDYGLTSNTNSAASNQYCYSGGLAAYAGVVGLAGSYQGDTESRREWWGSFNLRLFGRALQDTHINLEYGLTGLTLNASSSAPEIFQNQYGGVSLDLYLTKKFGLEGVYRRLLPANSNLGRTLQGEQETAGAFIDFGFLRVFGNLRNEVLMYNGGGVSNSNEYRQGIGGGLRVYF